MKKLLLGLLLVYAAAASAQTFRPDKSVVLPLDATHEEEVEIRPLGADGFMIERIRTDGFWDVHRLMLYDSTLTLRHESQFKLRPPNTVLYVARTREALYWLCSQPDSEHIQIYKVSRETGEIELIEGDVVAIDQVSHFKVLGNSAYLAGQYQGRPVVVAFRFFDKSSKPLPGLYTNRQEISDVLTDEASQQLFVLTRSFRQGSCRFRVQGYHYDGSSLLEVEFGPDQAGHLPRDGRLIRMPDGGLHLVGTYADKCDKYVQGIFQTPLSDSMTVAGKINYYPFASLPHWLDYLPERRRQRQQARLEGRRERGRSTRLMARITQHALYPHEQQQYLWVGETYTAPGRYTGTGTPAAEDMQYQFDHAVFVLFGKDGIPRLDASVNLNEAKALTGRVNLIRTPDGWIGGMARRDGKAQFFSLGQEQPFLKRPLPDEQSVFSEQWQKHLNNEQHYDLLSWHNGRFLSWAILPATAFSTGSSPFQKVFIVESLVEEK